MFKFLRSHLIVFSDDKCNESKLEIFKRQHSDSKKCTSIVLDIVVLYTRDGCNNLPLLHLPLSTSEISWVHLGDIMSTSGMFSTSEGYYDACGRYLDSCEGYHEYIRDV